MEKTNVLYTLEKKVDNTTFSNAKESFLTDHLGSEAELGINSEFWSRNLFIFSILYKNRKVLYTLPKNNTKK